MASKLFDQSFDSKKNYNDFYVILMNQKKKIENFSKQIGQNEDRMYFQLILIIFRRTPTLRWAQNNKDVLVLIKFSLRLESPGCKLNEKSKVPL